MTAQPDIKAIAARHTPIRIAEDAPHEQTTICTRCEGIWPCDTTIVIERLRAVEAERDDIKSWCDDQISIQLTLQDRANDEIDKRRAVEAERDQLQRQAEALPEALARVDVELQKAFDRANDEVTDLTASFDRARAERDRWREDAERLAERLYSEHYERAHPYDAIACGPSEDALAAHDAMTASMTKEQP